jgi:hypothetical protein
MTSSVNSAVYMQAAIEPEATREDLIQAIISRKIQVKKSVLPEEWSLEAADFTNKLLQKRSTNRLGYRIHRYSVSMGSRSSENTNGSRMYSGQRSRT